MKRSLWIASGAIVVIACCVALAQQVHLPWQTGESSLGQPKQSVQFFYPLQLTLPAGKPTPINLQFRVLSNLHINSHKPTNDSFIPTTLSVAANSAVQLDAITFPPGELYRFAAFPDQKLSVYTGEFTVHATVTAPRGDHMLIASLRYQACDTTTNSCYPPRLAPVAIDIVGK